MKRIKILFFLVVLGISASGQVTDVVKVLKKNNLDTIMGWSKGGMVALTFSQVSLTNWSAGGENSIAGNGFVNLFANLKKEKSAWDNNLEIGYGMIRQGNSEAPWVKSEDKIDFTSKYGQKASKRLFYAGLLSFKSQFAPGYSTPGDSIPISRFMAPGYLLAAAGMDYKPNKFLSVFVAPVTCKMTFVLDQTMADGGAFGVTPAEYDLSTGDLISAGKKTRAELGGYLKMNFKKDIKENFSLATRLELFSNYLENPQNIDVMWENVLTLKISKFISANLTTTLLYDDDIDIGIDEDKDGVVDYTSKRIQFKEVLGVGFSYKF